MPIINCSADAEQQAARAALDHAATERRRTRARMQKEHDASQRRSAQTLRVVDTLNIASFERVKYKGAAKERPGTLHRQHREQNSALNAAVVQARERVEEDAAVMFTLPGSQGCRWQTGVGPGSFAAGILCHAATRLAS